jgi:tankyrase
MDIFDACRTGDLERVTELVHNDKRLADVRSEFKLAPLHYASFDGHLPVVKLLLSKGVDVDSKSVDGWGGTPLHVACVNGHLVIVKFLVSKGASLNAKTGRGYTPLHYAYAEGDSTNVAYLERQPLRAVFLVLCHSRVFSIDLVRSLFTYL